MGYPVQNLGQSTWQLLQPYGGWGYNPPPPPAGKPFPIKEPPPPAPPTNMGYASDAAVSAAYNRYQDAFKSGNQSDINGAFSDYKAAADKAAAEQPLRDQMEDMAKQVQDSVMTQANAPFLVTANRNPTFDKEAAKAREEMLIAKMEKTWPGWYQGYLDWKVYQYTGGQPEWYRNLKEGAASALEVAMDVLPFLPYIRGAGGMIRPWVPTPGRSPVPTPAPRPAPTPSLPPARPMVPTTAAGQWWQNREQPPPPVATPSASQVWQRYNQAIQSQGASMPSAPPMVPSVDVRSLPPMSVRQAIPIQTWFGGQRPGELQFKPAITAPPSQMVPSIDTRTFQPQPQPTGMAPAPSAPETTTAMAPPPVATPSGGGGGAGQCPPGQFWDGRQCRGSVSMPAGGVPGGAPGTPTGGAPSGGYSPAGLTEPGLTEAVGALFTVGRPSRYRVSNL